MRVGLAWVEDLADEAWYRIYMATQFDSDVDHPEEGAFDCEVAYAGLTYRALCIKNSGSKWLVRRRFDENILPRWRNSERRWVIPEPDEFEIEWLTEPPANEPGLCFITDDVCDAGCAVHICSVVKGKVVEFAFKNPAHNKGHFANQQRLLSSIRSIEVAKAAGTYPWVDGWIAMHLLPEDTPGMDRYKWPPEDKKFRLKSITKAEEKLVSSMLEVLDVPL